MCSKGLSVSARCAYCVAVCFLLMKLLMALLSPLLPRFELSMDRSWLVRPLFGEKASLVAWGDAVLLAWVKLVERMPAVEWSVLAAVPATVRVSAIATC